MSIHVRIRKELLHAVVPRCEKPNCKLDLSGMGNDQITVLDLDLYSGRPSVGQMTKIADFLVFISTNISVVEMKTKAHEAASAAEQLREGAKLSDRLLESDPHGNFVPLLLHRGIRKVAHQKLLKEKVRFRGKDYRILVKPCGTKLRDVLPTSPL